MKRFRRPPTVWLVGTATAFSLLGDQALYSTLPIYFEELGLHPFEVGVILSANRWIRLATNELAHRLSIRADQRLLFVAAVALGAITTAIYALRPGFALFVLARLLWGLCWSFIRHLGVLSVMAAGGAERSGHSAGRLGGISRAGSVGGLFGGALLVDWLGFGPSLALLAGLSAVAIPLGWFGFRPGAERTTAAASGDGSDQIGAGLLGFAHGMVGPGLVMATLGAVLDDGLGDRGWISAASVTGAVLALRFVLESGAAARLGAISDRHGVRVASASSFAVGAFALLVAAISPWLVLLIAAVVVFFVAGTALGAGLIGFAGRQGSKTLARYATASDLGSASGPVIGWIALGVFDERTIALAIGAAVYGLSAVVALRFLQKVVAEPVQAT